MILGEVRYIDSDKDTHFTGALAQNAIETENLSFPTEWANLKIQALVIVGVNIQSEDNLDWDIVLWGSDVLANADVDLDTFIDYFTFALASGKQIAGAGQFYYPNPDNNMCIYYKDADNTSELHVGLVNRSAGAKTAGATGEFKVRFAVRPVLGG